MSQFSSWMGGHCVGRKWEITTGIQNLRISKILKNGYFRPFSPVSLAQQSKWRLKHLKPNGGRPWTSSRNHTTSFAGSKRPKTGDFWDFSIFEFWIPVVISQLRFGISDADTRKLDYPVSILFFKSFSIIEKTLFNFAELHFQKIIKIQIRVLDGQLTTWGEALY